MNRRDEISIAKWAGHELPAPYYLSKGSDAITLLPVLVERGHRVVIASETDEIGKLTGEWRCKISKPAAINSGINCWSESLAQAIGAAILQLIDKEEK